MMELIFQGPMGRYTLSFEAAENAPINMVHESGSMVWHIEVADGDGVVSGLTRGAKELWGDEFWFELTIGPPAHISYFGDQILARTDHEVAP